MVVDIQNNSSAAAAASVTDQLSVSGTLGAARPIKIAAPALTKSGLLDQVKPEIQPILKELFQQLESIGLVENTKTAAQLRYGVVSLNSGEFLPILYLDKNNIWAAPTKRVLELVGKGNVLEFRKKMNPLASFWRPDQLEKMDSSGCGVKYASIKDKIPDMLNVLESFKRQVSAALEDEYLKV